MTIADVREILKGSFTDPEDRAYWERKLEDMQIKERTAKENAKYRRINAVYDRL
jgi:hypothetical protein